MIISNTHMSPTIDAVNRDTQIFNDIKKSGGEKAQLEKVSQEFESIFITQMLNMMDKTVDNEGGIFGKGKYMDHFKSFIYSEMGREMSQNPRTTFGFAKQIYEQMEKFTID
ncbi:rod-binding protein [bacterium]|nr:rod-binding protein [bacterium]